MSENDIPIFPDELMKLIGIRHPNTLRVQIKSGKIPKPDVRLSQKTRYWHRSTLVQAGLLQPLQMPGINQSA